MGLQHQSQHSRTPCVAVRHWRCRWLGVSDLRVMNQRIDKIWHHLGWLNLEKTLYLAIGLCTNRKWWTIFSEESTLQEGLESLIFFLIFHISCQVCNVAAQCCNSIVRKPWVASLIKFYQDSRLQQERTYLANETTQQVQAALMFTGKTRRPGTQPCNITTGNGVKWIEMVSETGAP